MMAEMNRGFSNTGQQARHSTQGGRQEESSGGLAGSVLEGAQNVASNVGHAAEQAWDTTKQYAQQAGTAVANAAETAWDSTTTFMRRYPFATLAIGFGLGFLVCMAVSNRS
jgi:ElaB/YqjD/DUF883 family membrane-anchored ribosome-binding protein